MKKKIFLIQMFCFVIFSEAQVNADSQKRNILKANLDAPLDDSTRFKLVDSVWVFIFSNPDVALKYIQENILLSKKMKSEVALSTSYGQYAALEQINGNYPIALDYTIQSLRAAERSTDFILIAGCYKELGVIHQVLGDSKKAFTYLEKSKSLFETHWKPKFEPGVDQNTVYAYLQTLRKLAEIYEHFNHLDSALKYANYVYDAHMKRYGKMDAPAILWILGNISAKMGSYEKSLDFYRSGVAIANTTDIKKEVMDNYIGMAKVFQTTGEIDSSIFYANKVLEVSKVARNIIVKMEALNLLATAFKSKRNNDSVAKYLDLTIATKDSLFSHQKIMQVQSIAFNEQLRQQEIQEERTRSYNRVRNYILMGGSAVLLLVAGILYRSNRQKQKAKIKIEKAYTELKSTQAQLIQSEKMASLGELTAGIAHEIQNPLNFVNNFSEVSNELMDEMKEEIKKGNYEEVTAIANDVKQNLEKINHHGKRADAIVKGMLQHSQTSTGLKEPTNINKLADEYLRLAYHGLRAKDKEFNATIKTEFDETIGNINIIPQDIGRVMLNLINNAFYAVDEKKKQAPPPPEGGIKNPPNEYEPTVTVKTSLNPPSRGRGAQVLISVSDNGNGIPQKIVDKIFQPFFTTKPTGQGTGLGLSLAYDIVKAHGGELKVETREGEETTFIITL